jgi:phosphatidylserine decarboxylase
MTNKTEICYRDRETQTIRKDPIFSEHLLRWLYESKVGYKVLSVLLNNSIFCGAYGLWQKLPMTRKKIPEFVDQYGIKIEEIELSLDQYQNFNDFFCRKLKPEARPFASQPEIFCSPSDGKVLVYPNLETSTQIPIKGTLISVATLLDSEKNAHRYQGGSVLVIRLAPYDYHRFHFSDDGVASSPFLIPGEYHSVNPIALAKVPDIYCRNKRVVTDFRSHHFGHIAYIEVGALTVASIIQTYTPGEVMRGKEKGFFQYGGSTLVLLFEAGAINFDADLIKDSADNLEVHVLAGRQLGKKP